jgi:hypothetical protein
MSFTNASYVLMNQQISDLQSQIDSVTRFMHFLLTLCISSLVGIMLLLIFLIRDGNRLQVIRAQHSGMYIWYRNIIDYPRVYPHRPVLPELV